MSIVHENKFRTKGRDIHGMKYKIALIQADFPCGALASNLQKAEKLIREAARQDAKVICLPESFNQGYGGAFIEELVRNSEPENGETLQKMMLLAKELEVYLIAPLFAREADGACYNKAFLISDGGEIVGSYSKSHLIDVEKGKFAAGDQYPVFDTKYGRIGILICNDLCFVETARMLGLQGAEVIFVTAAWRYFEDSAHWWEQMLCGRALNNQVFVAATNRIGPAEDYSFAGETMVVGPNGFVCRKLLFPEERVLVQEICLEDIAKAKADNIVIMQERKPGDYRALSEPVRCL